MGTITNGQAWIWAACPCQQPAYDAWHGRCDQIVAQSAMQQTARDDRAAGLHLIERMTFASYDPHRLRAATPALHPFNVATTWLQQILEYGSHADYRDPASPPAGLYFYSAGTGSGKTHLAAAIANEVRRHGKRAVFLDEQSFLRRRWSCPFEAIGDVVNLPADAWLLVIDDMGSYEQPPKSVPNIWLEVLDPRWLGARWTIVTSNRRPHELVEAGTLTMRSFSRLCQLTAKRVIEFAATDARLEVGP